MDSDQGKLFIGGISWETDEEKLKSYFQGYGEVLQVVVMRDKITGRPRGFGFVVFADPSVLDSVVQDSHVIDGRTVEAKKALSRDEQVSKVGNSGGSRNFVGGGDARTKKIFVGGLPPTLNEDGFRQYFEAYGMVTDVVIMYDQQTNRHRGFGFISFDSEEAVDRVLHKTFHELSGKKVEVKRATPKDSNSSGGGGRSGSGQDYMSSIGNSNSYDGRMESNRYTQSQTNGQGGYPSYASSGYNMPDYGYGPTNNGMGYGYGNYGVPASGGYGNPNAPNAAAYGGPQNAQRNLWGSQVASGYNGGAGTGQSPGGASGYGNQGYSYGAIDGAYGSQGSYGGAVSGPAGSAGGYGDGNGNGNAGWRSDQSQVSGGYGGSYGGASN
ncbi:nuclear ribonucleoprotein 1 [Castilleja foliolosa]|uniref:Nuclear ribonucleoprotein 1 n=1 Tax=Castilleja foliolosa TaxID=1961234 RepID=A0ABD3E2M2_9LAMI